MSLSVRPRGGAGGDPRATYANAVPRVDVELEGADADTSGEWSVESRRAPGRTCTASAVSTSVRLRGSRSDSTIKHV